jgi:hypothetical protein
MSTDKSAQIQTPSFPGLITLWEYETARLHSEGIRLRGRKLWKGNLINALLAWFLDQDEDKRTDLARKMIQALDPWLDK